MKTGAVLLTMLPFLSGAQFEPPHVGNVSFANSGAPAAQRAFHYGLAQLHNFEYDDAARAFREAQQSDPDFVMAYWGEAMTKNHPVWMEQDLGGARQILARLGSTSSARSAKAKTDRERAYLHAVETLYGSGDKNARDTAYLEEMRRLHAAYPDDVDATAFYGLALLGSAHAGRDDAIYQAAATALEPAFATHPNHPGLAHYLIHCYDDPAHARLGLPAAAKYFAIAPAAPHALHMTSHIYLAAGMWDEVVKANEQAIRVSAERAQKAGRAAAACGHANMWLMYGYLQQGRPDAARRVLDGCRTAATGANGLAVRSAEQDFLDPDNSPAGSYIQMWSRYIIDTEGWSDTLVGEDLPLGDLANAKLTRAFVRALAAARRLDTAGLNGAVAQVQHERQAFEKVLADRHEGARGYQMRAEVLDQEIRALVLLTEDHGEEAIAVLREAASKEEAMPVEFGPPFVDKPAPELLGDVLAGMGRAADAAAAYESALRRTPNRAASIKGLARARSKAPV